MYSVETLYRYCAQNYRRLHNSEQFEPIHRSKPTKLISNLATCIIQISHEITINIKYYLNIDRILFMYTD